MNHEKLIAVLSELQIAANNCSMSIHTFLNAIHSKEVVCDSDMELHKKTAQYLMESLDGLQEIRKLTLRKKNLYSISINQFSDHANYEELLNNVQTHLESLPLFHGGVKVDASSDGSCNYGYVFIRNKPILKITKIPPASPWLSEQVKYGKNHFL